MTIDFPKRHHKDSLRKLWKESFGDSDEFLDIFEKTALNYNRCRCITEGTDVLASLYWFDCTYMGAPVAYLYAISTTKQHRGRGLCHILMDDTHKLLRSLGYVGAVLVPGNEGLFDFYGKMGYVTFCSVDNILVEAQNTSVEIARLNKDEYGRKRDVLLPKGAVLQHGENLDFLQEISNYLIL